VGFHAGLSVTYEMRRSPGAGRFTITVVMPSAWSNVGNEMGTALPLFASTTLSDFKKSSKRSAGTSNAKRSPCTIALRSK